MNAPVRPIPDPHIMRMAHAETLAHALANCHPADADAVLSAYVADMLTGGPQVDVWATTRTVENLRRDAEWWAETAPQLELAAYLTAALEAVTGRPMARTPRKRLMAALWNSMGAEDRAAFAKWAGLQK